MPSNRRLSTRQEGFQHFKVKTLLAIKFSGVGIVAKKSDMLTPDAGRGLLTVRPMEKNTIVGYFYCFSVYEDLSFSVSSFKKIWRGHEKHDGGKFLIWASRLQKAA